jgi:hypothetical protein
MSDTVKDVCGDDIALIELQRTGRTEMPGDALQRLAARGHLTLDGGTPTLTITGANRAARLAGMEHDLQLMAVNGESGAPLRTVGGLGQIHG